MSKTNWIFGLEFVNNFCYQICLSNWLIGLLLREKKIWLVWVYLSTNQKIYIQLWKKKKWI